MKIKSFSMPVEKPKTRKKPVPASKVIKTKKQYTRKSKYLLSFLEEGYEL